MTAKAITVVRRFHSIFAPNYGLIGNISGARQSKAAFPAGSITHEGPAAILKSTISKAEEGMHMQDENRKMIGRRDFARLMAAGGTASLIPWDAHAGENTPPLPQTPGVPDEAFWTSVRRQFLMPPDVTVLCAANLCPTSAPVIQALLEATRDIDRDPGAENRRKWGEGREETRRVLAGFLNAKPEEIVITRNTSEGNNIISSGVDLKPGDEVLLFADNHPSVNSAFQEKAKRFGFSTRTVELVEMHPGAESYIDAFRKAVRPATRLLAFTHVTGAVGDLFPAKEICRMARAQGILTLVDGAQSFGVLHIDLMEMQPDFFTGSAHKWPCGPKEFGVLYINPQAESRLWPSVISLYGGAVGASRRFEAMGQRDEAGFVAFGEALKLQNKIGTRVIEARSRALAQRFIQGLQKIDGVRVWTHPSPERSAAIVTFLPGKADAARLAAALYEKEHIVTNARGTGVRGGIRLSPHFYVLQEEVDRTLAAIKKYMAGGSH
jgi:isopenicillin-N epimerase